MNMHSQNESNLLLTERGYPHRPIECDTEWQANAQQAAMQMPAYAIGASSGGVAKSVSLANILAMVDALVVSWVDSGDDSGHPAERVAARKRLESAIRAHFAQPPKAQPVLTDAQIFAIRESIHAGDGWDGDIWDLAMARAIIAATSAQPSVLYVEVRECEECGHIGINDEDGSNSACNYHDCGWHGPSPVEDHCPGCHRDGSMSGSCTKCGHRTVLLADTNLPIAQQIANLSTATSAPAVSDAKDAARMSAIAENYWKLDPFEMPTAGGDDADVGWRVVQYHMDAPHERIVAEVYADDPRAAVDAAMK